MNKIINVGNCESALEVLRTIKENEYVPFDIRITNSHINMINELTGRKIFKNNSLYIESYTLWEIMQPLGGKGNHNYHELTEDDIYNALYSIRNPRSVFVAKEGRFAIISSELSHFNLPMLIVIEVGVSTKEKINANINKIVTIYPKDNIEKIIEKMDKSKLLYENKK